MGMNKKILYSIIGLVLVGGLFSAVYAGPIINTITFVGLAIFKENAQFDKDVNIGGILSGQTVADHETRISEVENMLITVDRIHVFGQKVIPERVGVSVFSIAKCPPTHPTLMGGNYDLEFFSGLNTLDFEVVADFDIPTNSLFVRATKFTLEIDFGVRANALCAKFQ